MQFASMNCFFNWVQLCKKMKTLNRAYNFILKSNLVKANTYSLLFIIKRKNPTTLDAAGFFFIKQLSPVIL